MGNNAARYSKDDSESLGRSDVKKNVVKKVIKINSPSNFLKNSKEGLNKNLKNLRSSKNRYDIEPNTLIKEVMQRIDGIN